MYQPSLARVERLAEQGNLVPVYRELPADLETPVSVYMKLQDEGPSFLLESIAGGEHVARYSFVGVRPRALFSVVGDQVSRRENGHELNRRLAPGEDSLSSWPTWCRCICPICRASAGVRWVFWPTMRCAALNVCRASPPMNWGCLRPSSC